MPTIPPVVNVALSALSAVFFLIGAIGLSTDGSTMADVSWYYYSKDKAGTYLAPSGISYTGDGKKYVVLEWKDCKTSSLCSKGENDGVAAGALAAVALILAVLAAVFFAMKMMGKDDPVSNYGGIASIFVSLILSIASLGCWSSVESEVDKLYKGHGQSFEQGPGWILVLVGLLASAIALILGALSALGGGKTSPA